MHNKQPQKRDECTSDTKKHGEHCVTFVYFVVKITNVER